jgi:hypothetical protein
MRTVDFRPAVRQGRAHFNVYPEPVPEAVGCMLTALAIGVLIAGIAVATVVLIGAGI